MPGDRAAAKSGKPTASPAAYSCAPFIQLSQPRSCDLNHLPQAPNLEPQCLLSAGCQAVFPPGVATFEFALPVTHQAAGQQAIQIRVQRPRSQPKIPARLLLDRLHDSVAMQVRLRQRQKNMKRGGREWSIFELTIFELTILELTILGLKILDLTILA